MKLQKTIFAALLCAGLLSAAKGADAQQSFFRKYNTNYKPSFSANATGLFTRDITNQSMNELLQNNGLGLDANMRQKLYRGTDLELNYGYSRFGTTYAFNQGNSSAGSVVLKQSMHEATSAIMFHPHLKKLSPFVGVGGGAIDFRAEQPAFNNQQVPNQWRGTGLAEAGIDMPATKNMGFRVQGRGLFYRAPNYYEPLISTGNWVATVEPSAGVWFKF